MKKFLAAGLALALVASVALASVWTPHPTTKALNHWTHASGSYTYDVYDVDFDADGLVDDQIAIPVGTQGAFRATLHATLQAGTCPVETADPPPTWPFDKQEFIDNLPPSQGR